MRQQARDVGIAGEIGGRIADAVGQERCHREAACGMPDGGLQHVGERQCAVALQREAPGRQRARHGNRQGPDRIAPVLCVEVGVVGQ